MAGNNQEIQYSVDEELLFGVFDYDFGGSGIFPSIFNPNVSQENKNAVLKVVAMGIPLAELDDQYQKLRQLKDPLPLSEQKLSRSSKRYKSVTSVLQCLMGMPEHQHEVLSYVLANRAHYRKISQGMFGGHYNKFDSLLRKDPLSSFSNLCRDEKGKVLSPEAMDKLILTESDAHALLMSAVGNYDRAAIIELMKGKIYGSFINRADTLSKVANQIRLFPDWGLQDALGPLLEQKTNALFMADMNRLYSTAGSTLDHFRAAFWPQASRSAVDKLVADALSSMQPNLERLGFLLQVCAENGVDFYPGIVQSTSGFGAYLDIDSESLSPADRNQEVMGYYLKKTQSWSTPNVLGSLLIGIPPKEIAAHPSSTRMLNDLYQLTKDKSLLTLGDKKFNGMALEGDLGL